MKKTKVLVTLLMLLLVISCGKKGNGKDRGFDLKNSGGANQQVNEVQKYNYYIGVYNKLLSFEKTVGSYFEEVGAEAQFKKPDGSVNANFYDVKSIITELEKAIPAKPKMAELDKASENLLAVFKELKPLTEDMDSYYSGKDYTSDNYKKAQEFHTKLLEIIKKYDAAVLPFKK
jgi:putative liporotein